MSMIKQIPKHLLAAGGLVLLVLAWFILDMGVVTP